jgi:hypothetical protein
MPRADFGTLQEHSAARRRIAGPRARIGFPATLARQGTCSGASASVRPLSRCTTLMLGNAFQVSPALLIEREQLDELAAALATALDACSVTPAAARRS